MVMHKVFGVERNIDIPKEIFPTVEEIKELEAPFEDHEHGWFDSCIDNAKLHYRCFTVSKPKAVVIYLNGITSHSGEGLKLPDDGRKTNVALLQQVFNDANISLYSYDQYAHGYSEGGPRFFVPSWEKNLQDYLTFIRLVSEKHANEKVPLFLMGFSYGGNLSIHASRCIQDDPSLCKMKLGGAILLAPAILADMPPAPVYYLLRYVLAPLFPTWTPSFMPHPLPPERVWKDPVVLQLNRQPRVIEMQIRGSAEPFSLGTALSMVLALETVTKQVITGFRVPFFLGHGTDDWGVKIEGSDFMWNHANTPEADREFMRVQGGYHDLLSVQESQQYVERIVRWIESRL